MVTRGLRRLSRGRGRVTIGRLLELVLGDLVAHRCSDRLVHALIGFSRLEGSFEAGRYRLDVPLFPIGPGLDQLNLPVRGSPILAVHY
jgi:hypothetical protein